MEARHKKELKALDTEKRAALKKIKATAGKSQKAKELLATVEAEFDDKLKELLQKHQAELSSGADAAAAADNCSTATESAVPAAESNVETEQSAEQERNNAKLEKARRKREKAREKERERERQIAEEIANAGPSPRRIENEMIRVHLQPEGLQMLEVAADGHCLYRAVAAQASDSNSSSDNYQEIRQLCADTLAQHEEEFAPFCEYTDNIPDFATYCERVRYSADWGGHLELRVLSMALKRPVWIYSATGPPLVIEATEQVHSDGEPIRLSYHRNYYALGEHYNQVVAMPAVQDET